MSSSLRSGLRVRGSRSQEPRMPCSAAPGSSSAPIPVNKQKYRAEGGERMRKRSRRSSRMLTLLR